MCDFGKQRTKTFCDFCLIIENHFITLFREMVSFRKQNNKPAIVRTLTEFTEIHIFIIGIFMSACFLLKSEPFRKKKIETNRNFI